MAIKSQLNIRVGDHCKAQIALLCKSMGLNATEVILLAIERLAAQEAERLKYEQ